MNYRMILYMLGWISVVEGAAMLLPTAVGIFYGENWLPYAIVAVAALALGALVVFKKPKRNVFYAREGFIIVALAWIFLSVVGAVPFVLTKEIPKYYDALFEMASGFSTTGASILTDVEALSHASLLWRSFSHWLGGMGVLVFLLALLPLNGGHIMQLMKAESTGPSVEKFVPKVRQTALILYVIYFSLTVIQAILLLIGGMPWFDSLCTAFATAGTGGFSIKNAGMSFYQSYYLQGVVTVFMLLFSVSFSVYYLLLCKKFVAAFKNEELKTFLIIVASSILLITFNVKDKFYAGDLFKSFHDASFTVAAIVSTTGFSTADFDAWPQISKFVIFILMFVGACAGSTGGGMKVSRLILLVKSSFREVASIVHPRGVKAVRIDKKPIDSAVIKGTTSYFVISMIVFVASAFIISLDGFDMITSISAVAATMNNIGPGFSLVGPTGNFSMFSPLSKIVMIFDMLAGRLEFFPMLVLLSPATFMGGVGVIKRRILWKKETMFQKEKQ